jgi:hypothetical protein
MGPKSPITGLERRRTVKESNYSYSRWKNAKITGRGSRNESTNSLDGLKDVLRQRRGALATASGIVSTLVGAVTLAEIAPDPAMASAILSNAEVLIGELIRLP